MSNDTAKIPKTVLETFPVLSNAKFLRRLASPVPLIPDTMFDIYIIDSQGFLALVTTDYVDPHSQSRELKSISGQYGFEFINLIKPYDKDNGTIEILEHDEMETDFFVVRPYKSYKVYYYLANLKTKL